MVGILKTAPTLISQIKEKHLFHGDTFRQQGPHLPEGWHQPILLSDVHACGNMDGFLSQVGRIGIHASLPLIRDRHFVGYPLIVHLFIGVDNGVIIEHWHILGVDYVSIFVDEREHFIF